MSRTRWIVGLSAALVVYLGFTALEVRILIREGHLHPIGWFVLASGLIFLWILLGYLRFRAREEREAGLRRSAAAGREELPLRRHIR